MRKCGRCNEQKDDSEFPWKNKSKGWRQSSCKPCQYLYQQDWYKRNRTVHISKVAVNKVRYAKDHFEKLVSYLKGHPCIDCGEDDVVVLEFDHRGEKKRNVSLMIGKLCSWERVLEEIARCDVRCCNCHRRKTARQLGWKKAILCAPVT